MFIDISNTSPASRPGTLDFAPVGVTWVNPGWWQGLKEGIGTAWMYTKAAAEGVVEGAKNEAIGVVKVGVQIGFTGIDAAALVGKGMVNTVALTGFVNKVDFDPISELGKGLSERPGETAANLALNVVTLTGSRIISRRMV